MAEQEKKRRPASTTREETTTEEAETTAPSPQGEKLKAELDDLLDEIDEVLEENAEEFVRNYVQKRGEEPGGPAALSARGGPGPQFRRPHPPKRSEPAVAGSGGRRPERARFGAARHHGGGIAFRPRCGDGRRPSRH